MIHVIQDYYIKADDRQYTLVQKTDSVDKDGNTIYKTCHAAYCSSIENAVKRCRELIIARDVQDNDYDLKEAVELVNGLDRRFEEMIERALRWDAKGE